MPPIGVDCKCLNNRCVTTSIRDWWEIICSNDGMKEYITNYQGSDQELVNDFEEYCISLETDLSGCPVEMSWSTFVADYPTTNGLFSMIECNSVCEWRDSGTPDYGHRLFNAYWYTQDGERTGIGTNAGTFTVQEHCPAIIATIYRFMGLQKIYW